MRMLNVTNRRGTKKRLTNYILARQSDLLAKALAPWPRREAPLLEVNCGDGVFLPLLWHSGFDVIATEQDAGMRIRAQQKPLPDCDVRAATDQDLPFDDDSFDWVIVHLNTKDKKEIARSAREALRVARLGLMLTFWNSAAPAMLCAGAARRLAALNKALPWWRVWGAAQALRIGRQVGMGTLSTPPCTWRDGGWLAAPNEKITWLPLGAWGIVRLDMSPGVPLTGLALRIGPALSRPQPAMEYSQKNLPSQSQGAGTT